MSRRKQPSDFSHPVGSQFHTDATEEPQCQSARLPGVIAQKNKSERSLFLQFVDKGVISLLYFLVRGGGSGGINFAISNLYINPTERVGNLGNIITFSLSNLCQLKGISHSH